MTCAALLQRSLLLCSALALAAGMIGCNGPGPAPVIELVLPDGFRGPFAIARDAQGGFKIQPDKTGAFIYVVPPSGILWVKDLAPLQTWGQHVARYANGAPIDGQDENAWFASLGAWGDGQSDLEACDFYVGSRADIDNRTGRSKLLDEVRAEYQLRQKQ
jgi:hypothetical protein